MSLFLTSLTPASLESSAPHSAAGAGGALGPTAQPLLSHPGPEGLPVGTWWPRALSLSSLPSLHGSELLHLLSQTWMRLTRWPMCYRGAPGLPSSGSFPGNPEGPQPHCKSSTCVCAFRGGGMAHGRRLPLPHSLGVLGLVLSQGGKEVIAGGHGLQDLRRHKHRSPRRREAQPQPTVSRQRPPRSSPGLACPAGRGGGQGREPRAQTGRGLGWAAWVGGAGRGLAGQEASWGPQPAAPLPRRPDLWNTMRKPQKSSWRRPWSRGCLSQTCSCSPRTAVARWGPGGLLPGNCLPLPHRPFSTVTCVEPAVLGGEPLSPAPRLGLGPQASPSQLEEESESQGWGLTPGQAEPGLPKGSGLTRAWML